MSSQVKWYLWRPSLPYHVVFKYTFVKLTPQLFLLSPDLMGEAFFIYAEVITCFSIKWSDHSTSSEPHFWPQCGLETTLTTLSSDFLPQKRAILMIQSIAILHGHIKGHFVKSFRSWENTNVRYGRAWEFVWERDSCKMDSQLFQENAGDEFRMELLKMYFTD